MSKVDDELTRRLQRAERPVDADGLFDGLVARRSHRERLRRVQAGLVAFAVLAATVGAFAILTDLFDPAQRGPMAATPFGATGAIVVCGDATGGQICRIDPDALARGASSDEFVQLTAFDQQLVWQPAVSTDGTTVVFDRQDPDSTTGSLWTIRTDGADLTRLSLPESGLTNASWSPEGLLVAVADDGVPHVSGLAALAILDPDRAPEPVIRRIDLPGLAFPSAPRFSPDGTSILFAAGDDPSSTGSDVYIVDTDGSNLRKLTRTPRSEWTPSWSPDGQRITFASGSSFGTELLVCPLECSNPRPLEDPTGGAIQGGLPAWSPDGEWIAFEVVADDQSPEIHIARVDGTDVRALVSPASDLAWIPVHEANSSEPSVVPDPSVSIAPESRDIGLGVRMCDVEILDGIDWYGDGTLGAAWTGARATSDGRCPEAGAGDYVVAADLDGDGSAEPGGIGFLSQCFLCRPYATTDLDGDGLLELVVVEEASSTASYTFLGVSVPTSERSPGIYNLFVAPPGAPNADVPANEPLRLIVGGDEGYSGGVTCEDFPKAPVLVYTWVLGVVDVDTNAEMHVTRLQLGQDRAFHVLDSEDSVVPGDTHPPIPTAAACGVDFHPAA